MSQKDGNAPFQTKLDGKQIQVLIKKFKICKIPVNSMFQTSVTLNM